MLDWLYLGDRYTAEDRKGLLACGVKFVVNATPEDEVPNFYPEVKAQTAARVTLEERHIAVW